jgi:hypothetical protein
MQYLVYGPIINKMSPTRFTMIGIEGVIDLMLMNTILDNEIRPCMEEVTLGPWIHGTFYDEFMMLSW